MTWSQLHEYAKHNDTAKLIQICRDANATNEDAFALDDHKATPLHILCLHEPSKQALRVVISANRAALSERDVNGNTPLHLLLCGHGNVSEELVKVLITADPHCLSVKNHHGYLPLHVACQFGAANAAVISFLVKMNPLALEQRTKMGELVPHSNLTPLSSSPTNVADHMMEYYQNAGLKTRDSVDLTLTLRDDDFTRDGQWPLHIAIANSAPTSVVQLLIQANSRALHYADKYGNLPIHLAAKHGSSMSTLKILIAQWPESLHQVNRQSNRAYDLALIKETCQQDVTSLLAG